MMKIVRRRSRIGQFALTANTGVVCPVVDDVKKGRAERRTPAAKNRMNWAEARLLNGATVKQALTATTNHGCKKPGSAGFPSAPTVFTARAPVTSLPLSKNNVIIHRLHRPVLLSLEKILTYLEIQFRESRDYTWGPKDITC